MYAGRGVGGGGEVGEVGGGWGGEGSGERGGRGGGRCLYTGDGASTCVCELRESGETDIDTTL